MAKKKRNPRTAPRTAREEWDAQQVEARLLATSFPRLQMVLILSLAALSTFLSSASLVAMGLTSMGFRYALAVLGGYSFFMLLVRLWIAYQTRNWSFGRNSSEPRKSSTSSSFDLPDLSGLGDLGESVAGGFEGGGGAFGGAGASASWGEGSTSLGEVSVSPLEREPCAISSESRTDEAGLSPRVLALSGGGVSASPSGWISRK